jgi:hypothetical protein
MGESVKLREPWLVAIWPGMGSVALLAGSYLLQKLDAEQLGELDTEDLFELDSVDVKKGVVSAGQVPRNLFFIWRNPVAKRDLLIFVGEAQPESGGFALCQQIVDYAALQGVKQVFTFAAMATQLQPGTKPRVFAVATDGPTLKQTKNLSVEVLEEGQITGLNGVLLAAGAERGLHGICLLGELPFFAVGVPNPRAAQAVLERFTELAGIEMDFTDLERQADVVDRNLEQLMEQMGEESEESGGPEDPTEPEEPAKASSPPPVDAKARRRIESLFDRVRRDRSKAMELKQELDRLGVFKQYEDRFLDLFHSGE